MPLWQYDIIIKSGAHYSWGYSSSSPDTDYRSQCPTNKIRMCLVPKNETMQFTILNSTRKAALYCSTHIHCMPTRCKVISYQNLFAILWYIVRLIQIGYIFCLCNYMLLLTTYCFKTGSLNLFLIWLEKNVLPLFLPHIYCI